MDNILIPKNARVIRQFLIIHSADVMYTTSPKLIYDECLFSNGNNIFLSYSYNRKNGCIKQGICGETYLRNELINTLFDEKINITPHDTMIFNELIKDYISKDMNILVSDLFTIPLYSATNYNR